MYFTTFYIPQKIRLSAYLVRNKFQWPALTGGVEQATIKKIRQTNKNQSSLPSQPV